MRICFFGTYTVAEGYPVNRVLIKGLRQAGARVEECRQELWGGFLHEVFSQGGWLGMGVRLLRCYLRLVRRYWQVQEHECVVVGYAGHLDVLLARLLNPGRRRLVVLVAFISLYDTVVLDRQQVREGSWKAGLLRRLDWLAFASADLVLVDTQVQATYFAQLFGLPSARFLRSFVGEDDEVFRPAVVVRPGEGSGFRVLFFGTYVPLHGVEVILEAAALLQDDPGVEFTLVGQGQLYPQMRQEAVRLQLRNTCFVEGWVGSAELVAYIGTAAVCLGIFGRTAKAARVVPYKVFDALALKKPVITRDSPAIRELLTHEETALLCPPGDGRALAASIRRLRGDLGLAVRLAEQGYARFREQGAPAAIGRTLLHSLEERFGQ